MQTQLMDVGVCFCRWIFWSFDLCDVISIESWSRERHVTVTELMLFYSSSNRDGSLLGVYACLSFPLQINPVLLHLRYLYGDFEPMWNTLEEYICSIRKGVIHKRYFVIADKEKKDVIHFREQYNECQLLFMYHWCQDWSSTHLSFQHTVFLKWGNELKSRHFVLYSVSWNHTELQRWFFWLKTKLA